LLKESVLALRGPGVRVNAGRPGVRVIAKQFGVNPGTVQRISRPFEQGAAHCEAGQTVAAGAPIQNDSALSQRPVGASAGC